MKSMPSIELLISFSLRNFSFNPESKAGLTVLSTCGRRSISIKPSHPEEDGFGHRLGVNVKICSHVECCVDQMTFISSFLNGNYLTEISDLKPPFFSHGNLSVLEDGSLVEGIQFWFDWFPSHIKPLVDDAIEGAWIDFDRLLRTLRWRQRSSFRMPDRSLLNYPYWRTKNNGLYYAIPQRSSITHAHPDREVGWFGWGEAERLDFLDIWPNPEANEPLGHELQNEAELLIERAPRSALLMAVSAIEAGIKDHVSRNAPVTDWLMQEMPSPPVGKILRNYIPVLHKNNDRLEIWKKAAPLFKKIQDTIVPARNKLSHTGRSITHEEVRKYVKSSRDVLYLLDYLDGHDWALNQVSCETRRLVGLPIPHERFREVEISLLAGPDA